MPHTRPQRNLHGHGLRLAETEQTKMLFRWRNRGPWEARWKFSAAEAAYASIGDVLLPPPCAVEVRNVAVLLCQRQAYLELHLRTG